MKKTKYGDLCGAAAINNPYNTWKGLITMLGIIGALDIEVNDIIKMMEQPVERYYGPLKFVSGKIYGTDCVVAECGIGKINAAACTQTMILEYRPDRIINTGIAGGTSSKTHIGSVVIADKVVQHDFDTTALGDELGTLFLPDNTNIKYIPCNVPMVYELGEICDHLEQHIDHEIGTIATGDRFIAGMDDRRRLNELFGAIACEMEGGSIGQICYIHRIPFAVLRSISDDSSSDEGAQAEYSIFSEMAAKTAVRIISGFIRNHSH